MSDQRFNTGNPIGSNSPLDRSDNTRNLDELVNSQEKLTQPDRFGVPRRTWHGMEEDFQTFLVNSGYQDVGNYGPGITLTSRNQVFSRDGDMYRAGASLDLPYVTTGVWASEGDLFVAVGDQSLRQELASPSGTGMIGWMAQSGGIVRSLRDRLLEFIFSSDYASESDFNAAKVGKVSLDSDNRLRTKCFIAGTEELSGSAKKDAFVVGRWVTGTTDCHGFADRTIMDEVTDYGGYGAFDVTVGLTGDHNQNHVYSFQDRATYSGSGLLVHQKGFYSSPVHWGSGIVNDRMAIDIFNMVVGGTGTLNEQTGINIRNLTSASSVNVAIKTSQFGGYNIYSEGLARSWHRGRIVFGDANPDSNRLFCLKSGEVTGYLNPTPAGFTLGVEEVGASINFTTANIVRAQIATYSSSYSLRPGVDNAVLLGDPSLRWTQLFAATATISTSDAREKSNIRPLSTAEIAAAKDLAKEIGAYQFLAAVAEKGDNAREHIGMTVQRAIEVMQNHNLDPFGYSFICYDEWEASPEVRNEETGEIEQAATEAGDRYSFRFEGLLAFIAAGFEARLSALEGA